jgi:hypothetical protein
MFKPNSGFIASLPELDLHPQPPVDRMQAAARSSRGDAGQLVPAADASADGGACADEVVKLSVADRSGRRSLTDVDVKDDPVEPP